MAKESVKGFVKEFETVEKRVIRTGKRTTPEDDVDRLAENLFNEKGDEIEDFESFEDAYDEFLDPSPAQNRLKEKVFRIIRSNHPDVVRPDRIKKVKVKRRVKLKERRLEIIGRIKGKTVFAEKTFVVVKGKRVIRHRDRLGRFVAVSKATNEE